ncbi:MAG: sigma-70 family RNA polymerase sigma factor [Planctomycetes bacterium]|nr:sigma-70 family RNA polymerase sigma factor [Planctomycetota bacterium]
MSQLLNPSPVTPRGSIGLLAAERDQAVAEPLADGLAGSKNPSRTTDLRARAKALIDQEIGFIHNPEFLKAGDSGKFKITESAAPETSKRSARVPDGIPAYFAALYATPLLTATGETELFRRMNYLKFLANTKRSKLNPDRPDRKRIEEVESLLQQALSVRNLLAESNLRLVVSIARRLADPYYAFDDIVSDGNLALLNAIEKFDFSRGFRFSTYATHVIQRDLYRHSRRRRELAKRTASGVDDWLSATPDEHDVTDHQGEVFDRWQHLLVLMQQELTPREQTILAMRLGTDLETGPQTLQAIAGQLGISKERVRQLEVRAIARLQTAATQAYRPEDLPAAECEQ